MKGPAFDAMMVGALVLVVGSLRLHARARQRYEAALIPLPRYEVASLVRIVEKPKPVVFIDAEREGWF